MIAKELYEWLATQFTDLESAMRFIGKWHHDGQKLPKHLVDLGYQELCSARAMAYHVSNVLEGHRQDPEADNPYTMYFNTKYGSALVNAAWTDYGVRS